MAAAATAGASGAGRVLVYGAYGYSARLICYQLLKRKVPFAISGRSADKLEALSTELKGASPESSIESIVSAVEGLGEALKARSDIRVLLNGAGPFVWTFEGTSKACIAQRVHYLDITGEIQVFEHARHLGAQASAAGVALVPGVGFDVVPSDCLANKLKEALPNATHLEMAFGGFGSGGTSHGTATTIAINLGASTVGRVGGKIAPIGYCAKKLPLRQGKKPTPCTAISWGDVSTAFHSTGIPNIKVYTRTDGPTGWVMWMMSFSLMKKIMGTETMRSMARKRVKEGGPTDDQRLNGRSALWGRAWVEDPATGKETDSVTMWVNTRSGYELTSLAAVECAERLLYGRGLQVEEPKGCFTPVELFGSSLLDEVPDSQTKWVVERPGTATSSAAGDAASS